MMDYIKKQEVGEKNKWPPACQDFESLTSRFSVYLIEESSITYNLKIFN